MCTKALRIITLVFFSFHCVIKAVDPLSLVGGPLIKEGFDYAKGYWYSDEYKQKRILKKYLYSDTSHSAVLYGCNENFTAHCAELAQCFEMMEQYYAKSNELKCLMLQKDLAKKNSDVTVLEQNISILYKQIAEENKGNISFFQSLSFDDQQKLLATERNIVIEYESPEHYEEALNKIHKAFDSQ